MHTLIHCCAQGVCCPPGSEGQVDALAQVLEAGWPRLSASGAIEPLPSRDCFVAMARHLLEDADVVPKGMGQYLHKIVQGAAALHGNGRAKP